jgi:polyisoprenoid-binding protein YceI
MKRPVLSLALVAIAAVAITAATRAANTPPPPTIIYGSAGLRVRLVTAPDSNEARYRVREQLANIDFPSDAVGRTTAISGVLVLEDNGTVVAAESKFTIDLKTLQSDAQMRDRYIQRNTLQTEQYGTAEFTVKEIRGLRAPLPVSGELTVQVLGDLTVHGITRAVTWNATVRAAGQSYKGSANTAFTFADFSMPIPRVARVLSVNDTIKLEYDFHLIPDAAR